MTVAVAMRPDVEIAYWQKDGSVKIPITYQADDGTLVKDTIIPDDFIGLRWLKTGVVEPLLAESDRRKDFPRVRAKFIAYVHLWRQLRRGIAALPVAPPHVVREMRSTGQIPPAKPVYTIAGRPVMNFRVLWVAKGAERKEGLRRLARDLDGPQGEASGLFWFTHEAHYTDQPERVLEPVWQKARNDTWRPLLGA